MILGSERCCSLDRLVWRLSPPLSRFGSGNKEAKPDHFDQKTKTVNNSKELTRCKLIIGGTSIEHRLEINYLRITISSYEDIATRVKTNIEAGCLNSAIWRQKHITMRNKTKIYKVVTNNDRQETWEYQRESHRTRWEIKQEVTKPKIMQGEKDKQENKIEQSYKQNHRR